MKRYGFVFARGGSKGVKGKNIKDFCGKPLIAWAIEAGLESGMLDCMIVSTDSPEIAKIARSYGARTPFMRPEELARDNSPELLAWRHAVEWLANNGEDFDTIVSLPATAPLRTVDDIRKCIEKYESNDYDLLLTCQPAARHPMFNMYREIGGGLMGLYEKADPPITRRQDAPRVYDGTTMVYISSPAYIMKHDNLWDGKVGFVEFPRERAIDIDDELDFKIAEYLMQERMKNEVH